MYIRIKQIETKHKTKSATRQEAYGTAIAICQYRNRGSFLLLVFCCVLIGILSFSDAFAKEQGILTAKGDYNYPPYEYLNTENQPDGFNVDILHAVARAMNLDVQIDLGLWHEVRSEIETGKIDILMGMFETGERAKLVDFTVPYLITSYAVFVPDGSKIKSINDISNKKIIVQRGDLGHDYVLEKKLSENIVSKATPQQALEALAAGKADCAILPRLQGVIILKDKNIKHIKIVGSPIIQRKYCMAVAKGDTNLLAQLNEGLNIIKTSGEYYKIYNKWFGVYTNADWDSKQILKYVLMVAAPLLLIVLIVFLWNWYLKKQVALRTEKLRTTLNSIGDAVISTDTHGLVTRMNPIAEILTGWTTEDAIGKPLTTVFNIINATTGKPVENPVGKVLETGKIVGLANHTLLIAKNGQRYQIADSAAPILNKDQKIQGIVLVFRDVTEEYARQEELRRKTVMLNLIMNTIPSVVFWKDCNFIYQGCNDNFVKATGLSSPEEIIGKSDFELPWAEEDAKSYREYDERIMKTGIAEYHFIESYLVPWSHEKRWLDTSKIPLLDKDGNVLGVLGTYEDITERKKAEELLREQKRQLDSMVGHLPGFVYRCKYDNAWTMLYLSPQCENITGYTPEEFIRNKILFNDIIQAEYHERIHQKWQDTIEDKTNFEMEYQLKTATNEMRWIWERGTPVFDEAGNVMFLEGYIEDITEQKHAEEELIIAQRNLSLFINSGPDFFFLKDKKLNYILSNEANNNFLQHSEKELLGKNDYQLMPKDVAQRCEKSDKTAIIEKRIIKNIEIVGELIYETWKIPVFDGDKVIGVAGIIRDITEQKHAEEALQRSESKLRKITDNITDIIFTTDMNFNINYISPSIKTLTGFTVEEYSKRKMHERYTPATLLRIQSMLMEEMENEKDPNIEKERTRTIEIEENIASGATIYASMDAKFIRDAAGKPVGIQGVSHDITAQKRAEEELANKLVFQQKLIDSIPYPIFTKDANGVFVGCNVAYEKDFATTRDLMIGKTVLDLEYLPLEDRQRFYEEDMQTVKSMGHLNYEMSMVYADKQRHQVIYAVAAFSLKDGRAGGLIGMLIDITAQKRAEEAIEKRIIALTQPLDDNINIAIDELFNLDELQKLQDDFANATGLASIIVTTEGKPITKPSNFTDFCNEIVRKTEKGEANCQKSDSIIGKLSTSGPTVQVFMSGGLWDAGAGISIGGKHIANWLIGQVRNDAQSEDKIIAYAKEIGADVEETLAAFRRVPKMSKKKFEVISETLYTLATQLSNLAYQNIQQARFIAERKRVEFELIAAKEKAEESDKLKSAFLANMSHEIRTPMNGILGFAELLKNAEVTGEKRQQFLNIITSSGERLLSIINDLINISKIESGGMTVVYSDVDVLGPLSFMYDFFRIEAEKKGLQLFISYPNHTEPMIIKTDKEKIYAILTNLIKNALKFTKEGSITVGYSNKGEMLEFYVKDTGIGIPKEKQRFIFDRFTQVDVSLVSGYEGSGLGLAISKAYIEMLGGSISVESETGKGTTFYVLLPKTKMK